ncbi:hypothetical protein WI37_11995 [Burkholderia ubonensis]|nr:hypothetical protein WI37_11995 [Burkholderia ubonensis]
MIAIGRVAAVRDRKAAGFGCGAAPLGNMFRNIPDEEVAAIVEAAWRHGIRLFDTAPSFGAGLAELRLGEALTGHSRDDYVISTKVGRLVLDELEDATLRSIWPVRRSPLERNRRPPPRPVDPDRANQQRSISSRSIGKNRWHMDAAELQLKPSATIAA